MILTYDIGVVSAIYTLVSASIAVLLVATAYFGQRCLPSVSTIRNIRKLRRSPLDLSAVASRLVESASGDDENC